MAGDVEQITAFLRTRSGTNFCSACIADHLRLVPGDVRNALHLLGDQIVLTQMVATCGVCQRYTSVSGLPSETALSPDERIGEFLGERDGGFCQTCLVRALGLSASAVQKAAWRLRGSATVKVDVGACASCRRPRVLLSRC